MSKEITEDSEIKEIEGKFIEAMDDDFNTALAISYLYELVKVVNKTDDANKLAKSKYFKNEVAHKIHFLALSKLRKHVNIN